MPAAPARGSSASKPRLARTLSMRGGKSVRTVSRPPARCVGRTQMWRSDIPTTTVTLSGTRRSLPRMGASSLRVQEPKLMRSPGEPQQLNQRSFRLRDRAGRVRSLRGKRSHRTGSHPRGARASVATGWFGPFSARLARKGLAPPAEIAERIAVTDRASPAMGARMIAKARPVESVCAMLSFVKRKREPHPA